MDEEVPLVIYVDGEKRVIGKAVVQDDGTVNATLINPDCAIIVGAFAEAEDHYSLDTGVDELPKTGPWSLTVPLIPWEMQAAVVRMKDNLDRDGE